MLNIPDTAREFVFFLANFSASQVRIFALLSLRKKFQKQSAVIANWAQSLDAKTGTKLFYARNRCAILCEEADAEFGAQI